MIYGQAWNYHQVYFGKFNGIANRFFHTKWVPGLVFSEQNPFQIVARDSWNVKSDVLIELAMLEKHIRTRLITKRNVASHFFYPVFPCVIDQKLGVCVTAIVPGFSPGKNFISKFLFFTGYRFLAHATNLAIVPFTFALTHDDVSLRLLRMRDWRQIEAINLAHREWFRQWEATNPFGPANFDYKASVKKSLRQLNDETAIPFVIEYRGELVGQLNVSNILHGSVSGAFIGYWISPEVAGRGIMPIAVALATDYMFNVVGLHRIEIDIRPENTASLRVVEKLGFRFEGTKKGFIHINNAWRDHSVFALTADEVSTGLLNRYLKH